MQVQGAAEAVGRRIGGVRHAERRREPAERPPVGRLRDGRLLLDVRTVFPAQEDALVEAVGRAVVG